MGVEVGLDAKATFEKKFETTLYKQGIPELCTGTVFCIGPYVSVRAELTFKAEAEGTLLVGGTYGIAGATAAVVVYGGDCHAENWQPTFSPVFEADGEIELSVEFGLPVQISVGISALDGKYTSGGSPLFLASASAVAAGLEHLNAQQLGYSVAGSADLNCQAISIAIDLSTASTSTTTTATTTTTTSAASVATD